MDKPIFEVDYGLGSVYEDGIEINRKLTGQLRESIIKHERSHRNRGYSKHDFLVDFQAKNSNFFKSLKFALKNPESLIGFFPFMYSYQYKILTFNYSALVPFIWFGLLFSGFWWFVMKIPFVQTLICFTGIITLLNIVLLIYTHYYVKNYGKNYG